VPVYRLGDRVPRIDPSAWVHESAVLIGAVVLGPHASVWPGAVIRADIEPIEIGEGSNVQDGCVLHTDPGKPLRIGRHVTIGHQAMLHGCTIEDEVLIGIQSVVLNGSTIGSRSLLGAASLLSEGKTIPAGSIALGAPARVLRAATEADVARIRANAESYVSRARLYRESMARV